MRLTYILPVVVTAIGITILANMSVASAPKQLTMTFLRDGYSKDACLEYSWVVDNKRRVIPLQQLQQSDSRTDQAPPSPVSQVQVYRLTTDDLAMEIPLGWPFPLPIGIPPVVGATIEVFEMRGMVLGTVYYDDGSKVTALHDIVKDPMPSLPCRPPP
jgi:hypothetical protein